MPPPCKCTCHKSYTEQMRCMRGCDHAGEKEQADRLLDAAKQAAQAMTMFHRPEFNIYLQMLKKEIDAMDPGWSERAQI
jgi:hypothetical protein